MTVIDQPARRLAQGEFIALMAMFVGDRRLLIDSMLPALPEIGPNSRPPISTVRSLS